MAKCLLADHYFLFISLFVLARALASFGNANVPAAFFFGDSILDAGNNHFKQNCNVQADFSPYGQDFFHRPTGRFTNGRTVPDFISEYLGVDLQKPYLEVDLLVKSGKLKNYPANGINFASAGSGVMKETNQGMGVIPLEVQLQQFEDLVKQNKIDKNTIKQALYIFETGSNDVFFYFLPLDHQRDPDNYINMMLSEFQQAIQRLYGLGARKIAIFALGPVGCIPARLFLPNTSVDQCHSKMNEMVVKYNLGLEAIVNQIPAKLHGAIGVYADTFDVVSLFLQFPQHYGFVNVSSACCGSGTLRGLSQCGVGSYELCKNTEEYVFWDFFHPTEHAYNLIFKAFLNGKSTLIWPMNLESLTSIIIP